MKMFSLSITCFKDLMTTSKSEQLIKSLLATTFLLVVASSSYSQSSLFSIIGQPATLDDSQTKVLNMASSSPHIGDLKFVEFSPSALNEESGSIQLAIPGVNNGSPLNFQLQDAFFDSPTHYSLHASNETGTLTLYITPEGQGGRIDLGNRLFNILPFGTNKGLLIEKNMAEGETSICSPSTETMVVTNHFCEEDCGAAVLDVLLLITPEAQQWLGTSFGGLANWFLFVEANNINPAFANSGVPNKRVRVNWINYTPNFAYSTNPFVDLRIDEDVNAAANSTTAQNLMNLYRADMVVLLTNNNYTGPLNNPPGFNGTIFGVVNSLDPLSTNKFLVVQVANIDPSRFTLAHEIGHHFGCMHSNVGTPPVDCPHGMNMPSGRNTIMANNAPNNTRIQHFSNPVINWVDGTPTGVVDIRDNAAQIRGAFCEAANNFPEPQFATTFTRSVGMICPGETFTFTPTIAAGACNDPWGIIPSVNCGSWPYQYEWRVSKNPNFTNSQVVGNGPNLSLYIQNSYCPVFYVRLTVTSANGLTATFTQMYNCHNFCDRSAGSAPESTPDFIGKLQVVPNPASGAVRVFGFENNPILGAECYSLDGRRAELSFQFGEGSMFADFNVGLLPAGMYLLKLKFKDSFETIKFVVE